MTRCPSRKARHSGCWMREPRLWNCSIHIQGEVAVRSKAGCTEGGQADLIHDLTATLNPNHNHTDLFLRICLLLPLSALAALGDAVISPPASIEGLGTIPRLDLLEEAARPDAHHHIHQISFSKADHRNSKYAKGTNLRFPLPRSNSIMNSELAATYLVWRVKQPAWPAAMMVRRVHPLSRDRDSVASVEARQIVQHVK